MGKQISNLKFNKLHSFGVFVFVFGMVFQTMANECGKINIPKGLSIVEGNQTHKGFWPFAAAIYETTAGHRLFCGGTLISMRHVLTAAHCVQDKGIELKYKPTEIAVLLGAFVLQAKTEEAMKHKNVSEILVHPDWEMFSKSILDADVAILVLSHSATLNNGIQIVCLPSDDDVVNDDTKGFIVGWDLLHQTPKHSVIQVFNGSYCHSEDHSLGAFQSTRTFCGGADSGSLIRKVSGGGFFISSGSTWVQYGVSVSAINATGNLTGQTVVFLMNVAPFRNWIGETVRQSGERIGEAIKGTIDLECNFMHLYYAYACVAHGLDVQNKNFGVAASVGAHKTNQGNDKVELLQFHNGTMFYLVDGVGKLFPNLKSLFVGYSHSSPLHTKLIKRSNFQKMENLFEIAIHQSDIETIPEDLLWDLPNLSRFQLDGRLTRNLPERTFEKSPKLTEVYLASNALTYLPRNLFKYNLDLNWVNFAANSLKFIEIDFIRLPNLRYIFLAGNSCIDKDFNRTTDQTDDQYEELSENESLDYPQMRRIFQFQRLIYANCSMK